MNIPESSYITVQLNPKEKSHKVSFHCFYIVEKICALKKDARFFFARECVGLSGASRFASIYLENRKQRNAIQATTL